MNRLVVWIGAVATAGAILIAALPVTTDLADFLGDEGDGATRLAVAEMREGAWSRSFVATLADVHQSEAVAERVGALPFVERVENGRPPALSFDDPGVKRLFSLRYLLTSADLSVDDLRRSLDRRLADLASPAAPLLRPTIPADPTGAFMTYLASLGGATPAVGPNGVWTDGDAAYLVGMTVAPLTDDQLARLETAADPATLSGPAVFASRSRQRIRAEAEWITLAASFAMLLTFLVTLRSFRSLLLLALPMVTGGMAGAAAVWLVHGSIQGITLAFGATIIGVAIDYPLHALLHAEGGDRGRESDRLWPTLRLSALTTAVGYAAMLFSDLPGLAQLGIFSIVGLTISLLAVRFLLPPLLPKGPTVTLAHRGGTPMAKGIVTLLLAIGSGVWIIHGVEWNDDVGRLNPTPHEERTAYLKAQRFLAGPDAGKWIVALADTSDAALSLTEQVAERLDRLIADGALVGYRDATTILPTAATQRERQEALPDRATLESALTDAMAGTPFAPGAFSPFIDDLVATRQRTPVTPADLAATPVGPALAPLLHRTGDRWISTTLLRGVADEEGIAEMTASMPGVAYLNLRKTVSGMLADHREQGLHLALVGAGVILVLLIVSLGPNAGSLKVALTVALPVAATAGFMSLLGPLSLFHLIAFLLVTGLGVDYALFMARAETEDDPRSVASVGLSALSTALVFGILSFSSLPLLQEIGRTTATGVVLLFTTGWAFLPDRRRNR